MDALSLPVLIDASSNRSPRASTTSVPSKSRVRSERPSSVGSGKLVSQELKLQDEVASPGIASTLDCGVSPLAAASLSEDAFTDSDAPPASDTFGRRNSGDEAACRIACCTASGSSVRRFCWLIFHAASCRHLAWARLRARRLACAAARAVASAVF